MRKVWDQQGRYITKGLFVDKLEEILQLKSFEVKIYSWSWNVDINKIPKSYLITDYETLDPLVFVDDGKVTQRW